MRGLNNSIRIAVFLIFAIHAAIVFAVVPPTTLNYQGYLTDSTGNAINGSKEIQVNFFDAASGGSASYGETHAGVNVEDGHFSILLGSGAASTGSWPTNPDFSKALWLEITIEPSGASETLSPRIPFTPAPYARMALDVADAVVTEDKLAATLTFDDGDFLDFSGISADSATQGVKLPSYDVGAIGDGQITWDSVNDKLYVGDGAAAQEIGAGSAGVGDTVDSSEIIDGTIVDADISATAAIASTKISGLGALATLNAVGTAQITDGNVTTGKIMDGTITNVDISAGAAIASSKISGLGALAPLSTVGSGQITNASVTEDKLAAGLVFDDGDLIDLSGITANTQNEGLKLPKYTSAATGEGQITWDAGNEKLYVGTDGDVTEIGDVTMTGTQTLTNKTLSTPVITLQQGADVSGNTAVGQISWDSNDDKLYVGNGASAVEIGAGGGGGDNLGDHVATKGIKLKAYSSALEAGTCDDSSAGQLIMASVSKYLCYCGGSAYGWVGISGNPCDWSGL